MTKVYRLDVDLCNGKCALDIAEMSNEEKVQFISDHKNDVEEFTLN